VFLALKLNLQHPLDKVVDTTARDKTPWSADETVTFLYNPHHPNEIKPPSFSKLYIKNGIWLTTGNLIFIWWLLVKMRRVNI